MSWFYIYVYKINVDYFTVAKSSIFHVTWLLSVTSLYCKFVSHTFHRIYTLQCLQFVVPACMECPWWLKLSRITKYGLFRECTNSDIPITHFQERPKEGASGKPWAFPRRGNNEQYTHWKVSFLSNDLTAWSEQFLFSFQICVPPA